MTSMRMRLLFSLSCVHVLVPYIGGEGGGGGREGGGGGGGVMTSMRMRLLFSREPGANTMQLLTQNKNSVPATSRARSSKYLQYY